MSDRVLSLLRHAKAGAHEGDDHARSLTDAGIQQGAGVAAHLVAADAVPDLVLCSDATRTRQTWSAVATALEDRGVDTAGIEVRFSYDLYAASPGTVLDAVRSAGEAARVLVVGHEPIVSMTAERLADADSPAGAVRALAVGVPTATLVVLDVTPPWADLGFAGARLRGSYLTPAG